MGAGAGALSDQERHAVRQHLIQLYRTSADRNVEDVSPLSFPHVAELRRHFEFQGYIPETEHRAITLVQVQKVVSFVEKHCATWRDRSPPERSKTAGRLLSLDILNLYHLNDWVIKPATSDHNCAFVELFTRNKQTPVYFVSHWWGEKMIDFLRCLELFVKTMGVKMNTPFWVCAYANRQHSLTDELTSDPRKSSFHKALQLSTGVLLILDDRNEDLASGPCTPFERIWCAFELFQSIEQLQKPIHVTVCHQSLPQLLTDGLTSSEQLLEESSSFYGMNAKAKREIDFPVHIFDKGLNLSIENSRATVESDRVRILNSFIGRDLDLPPLQDHEIYAKVNQRLRARFAASAWQAIARKRDVNKNVERLMLPERLHVDKWRESLALSFAFCEHFDDESIASIARGFPKDLKMLNLNFHCCRKLGNDGIAVVACALPQQLLKLELCFSLCKRVGDAGVAVLADMIPSSLQDLALYFSDNSLSDAGVASLAQKLPDTLQVLCLHFEKCKAVGSSGLASLAHGLPKLLEILRLEFSQCPKVTDTGIAALAQMLPASCEMLELKVDNTGVSCEGHELCVCVESMRQWQPSDREVAKPAGPLLS